MWGVAGVLAVLADAIYKLTPHALALVEQSLGVLEIAVLVAWVAFNAYSEGYQAFHRNFSPRVVARARTLDGAPRPLFVAFAPLYCMGLFHATRRRLIVSWAITVFVVALVLLVRQLDQPWRGIVDAGVIVGLAWGAASIVYFTVRAFAGHAMPVAPDVPGDP
jgi:glucose uptake protein GlcU